MKARKIYCKFESGWLQWLVSHLFVAVAMHWTVQSMLYADATERRFRIGLDLALTVVSALILSLWWSWPVAWIVGFLIAHTLNFLFNAHLCALSKDYGLVQHTYDQYQHYVQSFYTRAQQEPAIAHVELRGGLTRQSWTPYSDLDVRLFRSPGFVNGLRASWFLLCERSRALFAWFPLDAYLRDGEPSTEEKLTELPAMHMKQTAEHPVTTAQAPTVDLFGRQDRGQARETTSAHPHLVYLRGAFVEDYGQTSYRIAYYLPEFGFDTTLVQMGRHADQWTDQGIDVVVLPVTAIPIIGGLLVNWRALLWLWNHPCDLLIVNPGLILTALIYKRFHPEVPLIVDIRSVPVEIKGVQGWLLERYFTLSVRARALDGLSVITPGTLQMTQERFGGRTDLPTVIWPSGVDEDLFDPALSGDDIRQRYALQDAFVLMYHGSLTPTRGLDTVLQAMQLLTDEGETRPLLIFIGKTTEHAQELMAQAQAMGIDDRVKFLPPVPHEEIPAYVAAADVGLDPLPDHKWWNFSSPMKVFEYLRMGKPVLATDILAHRQISDAVLLVPEKDPAALAAAIRQVMEMDTPARAQLQQAALQAGANNTWRMRAETLANFIHQHFLPEAPQ